MDAYFDMYNSIAGVQGYLKLSIQILGPGDKLKVYDVIHICMHVCIHPCMYLYTYMKVHDEEEEARKEKEASKRNGGDDLSSMGMYINVDMYICFILSLFL